MLVAVVLPPMTRELGLPDWMAGAIFSLSAAMWVVMSPFWGAKSTQVGRRPIIVLGLSGYALSMLLFGIVGSFALAGLIAAPLVIFGCLLASRSIFGLIGSGTNPAAQAYVAERSSPERRTEEIATVTAGFSFGTIAGPAAAAAVVAVAGLLAPVFVASALAAGAAIMIWFYLPENTAPSQDLQRPKPRMLSPLIFDQRVVPYIVYAMALSLTVGIVFQTFVFVIMDKFGVSGAEVGNYTGPAYAMGASATLLSQLVLIPRLHLSNRMLMVVGALLCMVGVAMIMPTNLFAVLVIAQFIIGLGQGLCRPGFFSGASLAVEAHEQGDVAGLMMAANAIGFVISPLFGPYLYEFANPNLPFLLATGLLALMTVFAWFFVPEGMPGETTKDQFAGDGPADET